MVVRGSLNRTRAGPPRSPASTTAPWFHSGSSSFSSTIAPIESEGLREVGREDGATALDDFFDLLKRPMVRDTKVETSQRCGSSRGLQTSFVKRVPSSDPLSPFEYVQAQVKLAEITQNRGSG